MKTVSQIVILSTFVSLAAAAGEGYVTSYTGPDCAQAAGAGGILQGLDTNIPQDTCANIKIFTSFQGGVAIACAKGTTPKVTVYTEKDCTGIAVDAGNIPLDGTDAPCTEILVKTGSSSVSVGGHSASFTCV